MLRVLLIFLALQRPVLGELHATEQATDDGVVRLVENHTHYRSDFDPSAENGHFWADIKVDGSNEIAATDRFEKVVTLSFDFPFYNNRVRTLTVLFDGSIGLGQASLRSGPLRRYIAPLMASCAGYFSSSNTKSVLRWKDTGDNFTVQWENMIASTDRVNQATFSFQATLDKNGRIRFFYKNVANDMAAIDFLRGGDLRIGIADYVAYETRGGVIAEWYDYIDFATFDKYLFRNSLTLTLTPLQSCHLIKDCASCAYTTHFKCGWCAAENRCVSETDKNQPELLNACGNIWIMPSQCSAKNVSIRSVNDQGYHNNMTNSTEQTNEINSDSPSFSIGTALMSIFIILVIGAILLVGWFCYNMLLKKSQVHPENQEFSILFNTRMHHQDERIVLVDND